MSQGPSVGQGIQNMSGPVFPVRTHSGLAGLKPALPVRPGRGGRCRLRLARRADGGVLPEPEPAAQGGRKLSKRTVSLPLIPAPWRQNCSSPSSSWVSSWAVRGSLSRPQALTCSVKGRIPSR